MSWTLSLCCFHKPGRMVTWLCSGFNSLAFAWLITVTTLIVTGGMNTCWCHTSPFACPHFGRFTFENAAAMRDLFDSHQILGDCCQVWVSDSHDCVCRGCFLAAQMLQHVHDERDSGCDKGSCSFYGHNAMEHKCLEPDFNSTNNLLWPQGPLIASIFAAIRDRFLPLRSLVYLPEVGAPLGRQSEAQLGRVAGY